MIQPRIETLPQRLLLGKRITTSVANNRTAELWRSFMPRRKEIKNNIGTNLYSLQVYGDSYFKDFSPTHEFEKWAAIEVISFDQVPDNMEVFTLPGGLYAVFLYKGPASKGDATFQYIFQNWIPNSAYVLDGRPHFEILDERYKKEDPDSEEEIWIPIKSKN